MEENSKMLKYVCFSKTGHYPRLLSLLSDAGAVIAGWRVKGSKIKKVIALLYILFNSNENKIYLDIDILKPLWPLFKKLGLKLTGISYLIEEDLKWGSLNIYSVINHRENLDIHCDEQDEYLESFRLLHIGSLSERKGTHLLPRVLPDDSRLFLVVAGEVSSTSYFRRIKRSLGSFKKTKYTLITRRLDPVVFSSLIMSCHGVVLPYTGITKASGIIQHCLEAKKTVYTQNQRWYSSDSIKNIQEVFNAIENHPELGSHSRVKAFTDFFYNQL